MAASYGGVNTRTTGTDTSSLTCTATGRSAGQLLVALFGHEPSSATINTLSGWALGGTVASAAGSNDVRATAFTRECDTTETNTWTSTANLTPYTAQVLYFNKDSGEVWEVTTFTASDNDSSGTGISLNAGDLDLVAGDLLIEATYGTHQNNPSSASLSIPGCSFTRSVKDFGGTTSGNDVGWVIDVVTINSGAQTGDLTLTYNVAAVGQSQAAATFTRIRAVVGSSEGSAEGTLTITGSATGERQPVGTASGTLSLSVDIPRTGTASGQIELIGSATGERHPEGYYEDYVNYPTHVGAYNISITNVQGGHPAQGYVSNVTALSISAWHLGVLMTRGHNNIGAVGREGTLWCMWFQPGTVTGITSRSGSATGTISFTGSASGTGAAGTGTATGSYSFDGSASGKRTPKGTAVGSHSYSGTSAGMRTPKGTASGEYGYTFTVITDFQSGTATGAVTFTGAAEGLRNPVGSATGGVTFVGSSTGRKFSSGTATGGVSFVSVIVSGRNDIRDVTLILKRGPYGYALDPNLQPRHALRVGHPQQRQIRIRSKRE